MTGPARPTPPDDAAERAAAAVRARSTRPVEVALVLGSGLGDAVGDDLDVEVELEYGDLPGFPPPSVPGHAGRLVLGTLYGVPTAAFRGRVHLYEGHGIGPATVIPRLASALGASVLVLTNAAGGLHAGMEPGQLMLITDHINLMGVNPMAGWRFPDGTPGFVDLTHVYDPHLIEAARATAGNAELDLLEGVYASLTGPSYETPAETEMLRRLGADAVGMSTVPEAVVGSALGMRVLAISCISNVAADEPNHAEVLEAARSAASALQTILAGVLETLASTPPGGEDGVPARSGTPADR